MRTCPYLMSIEVVQHLRSIIYYLIQLLSDYFFRRTIRRQGSPINVDVLLHNLYHVKNSCHTFPIIYIIDLLYIDICYKCFIIIEEDLSERTKCWTFYDNEQQWSIRTNSTWYWVFCISKRRISPFYSWSKTSFY